MAGTYTFTLLVHCMAILGLGLTDTVQDSCQGVPIFDSFLGQVTDLQQRVICVENTLDELTGGHGPHQRAIDCSDVYRQLGHATGLYSIWRGDDMSPFQVMCHVDRDGAWTLIQRRVSDDVDFDRNWSEYKEGFGNLGYSTSFWLGLEKIRQITSLREYVLRIDLEGWDGGRAYAQYLDFYIDDETHHYALHIGDYSGTAGDSLRFSDGNRFYTQDVLNNNPCPECGGWWYRRLLFFLISDSKSNLNGDYLVPPDVTTTGLEEGIQWFHLKSSWISLKRTTMRIRPIENN